MNREEFLSPFDPSLQKGTSDEDRGPNAPRSRKRRIATYSIPDAVKTGEDEWRVDSPLAPWPLKITQPAYRMMMDYLLTQTPEAAGLLLGPADDDHLITHFVADRTGQSGPASFELGIEELNEVLKRVKHAGINCKGIAHSHPAGIPSPSHGDLNYLARVFGLPGNEGTSQFFMPIVCGGRLYAYVYAQGRVWRASLVLI
jgi:proteasome lid subunit RPN8/RPN11